MPNPKSSTKDIIINVLILAVAGGVLAWRYNDCKQKEKQAEQAAQQARAHEEKERTQRTNACLKLVPETQCRTMSVDTLLKDGGPPSDDPSRIRYENRAKCMLTECHDACAKK